MRIATTMAGGYLAVIGEKRSLASQLRIRRYETDCIACHVPAKKDDWLYVRGYSILAKPTPPN